MTEWYTWIFSKVGVAVISALISAPISALISYIITKERFRRILFLERNQIAREIGTVAQRFANAKESVFISGIDCVYVVVSESPQVEKLLKRGVRVKILTVDPESAVPEMLSRIDPRFPTSQSFRDSMVNVKLVLRELKRKYSDLFEYRFLPILPALGFFIVDPHSKESIIKIELYTAKEWKPIPSRPHLLIKRKEKQWRNYFLDQWENYWTIAREYNSPNQAI